MQDILQPIRHCQETNKYLYNDNDLSEEISLNEHVFNSTFNFIESDLSLIKITLMRLVVVIHGLYQDSKLKH